MTCFSSPNRLCHILVARCQVGLHNFLPPFCPNLSWFEFLVVRISCGRFCRAFLDIFSALGQALNCAVENVELLSFTFLVSLFSIFFSVDSESKLKAGRNKEKQKDSGFEWKRMELIIIRGVSFRLSLSYCDELLLTFSAPEWEHFHTRKSLLLLEWNDSFFAVLTAF